MLECATCFDNEHAVHRRGLLFAMLVAFSDRKVRERGTLERLDSRQLDRRMPFVTTVFMDGKVPQALVGEDEHNPVSVVECR
jgi:hypothetical protein